ncbi:MAG: group 1 truncated hemoglobin [Bacteroidetes bacterium]|nr:group 1 truncated hemoglobin [Bacteroidota bacterium]
MKTKNLFPALMIAAIAGLFLSACHKDSNKVTPVKATLYDSLGGTAMVADPANSGKMIEKGYLGIRSVVDSTIFIIAADNRINGHFTTLLAEVTHGNLSGFDELSTNISTFVAVGTGAKNYNYTGMNMVDAHDPAKNPRMNGKATNSDFDAFEADLVTGANKNHVPANLITSLGKIVESLRSQVVQM